MSNEKKVSFMVTKPVAAFKSGEVIDLDPDNIPLALQAHVIRASKDFVVNPDNSALREKVDELEAEVEALLREDFEQLSGKKAGGNSKLSTLRDEVAKMKAEK